MDSLSFDNYMKDLGLEITIQFLALSLNMDMLHKLVKQNPTPNQKKKKKNKMSE